MTTEQTSPLPWQLHPKAHACVITSGRRVVANCGGHTDNSDSDKSYRENEANAALIVRAVNSYAAMISTLADLKEAFRFALLCTTPEIAKDGMELVRRADAALALAKEGQK